eukprot:5213613-Pleurochrysis_carterae.AAC.1
MGEGTSGVARATYLRAQRSMPVLKVTTGRSPAATAACGQASLSAESRRRAGYPPQCPRATPQPQLAYSRPRARPAAAAPAAAAPAADADALVRPDSPLGLARRAPRACH